MSAGFLRIMEIGTDTVRIIIQKFAKSTAVRPVDTWLEQIKGPWNWSRGFFFLVISFDRYLGFNGMSIRKVTQKSLSALSPYRSAV